MMASQFPDTDLAGVSNRHGMSRSFLDENSQGSYFSGDQVPHNITGVKLQVGSEYNCIKSYELTYFSKCPTVEELYVLIMKASVNYQRFNHP